MFLSRPISRVLSYQLLPQLKLVASVICLDQTSPLGSSGLPLVSCCFAASGASNLVFEIIQKNTMYMTLQLINRTAAIVTYCSGELLPHLFTLTSLQSRCNGAVIFCSVHYILSDIFPLGRMAPYVARTFLHVIKHSDRPACTFAKIIIIK